MKRVMGVSAMAAGIILCQAAIGGAQAQDAGPNVKPPVASHRHKKVAAERHHVRHENVILANDKGAEPAPDPMANSPRRFDKTLRWKGWDIMFPSFGDSLTQDYGGWRSALAQYGIGFLVFNTPQIGYNVLNHSQAGAQQYFGQRLGYLSNTNPYLTVDLSRYGIPDGQFGIGGVLGASTWEQYAPRELSLSGLQYYQTLLNGKVELLIGYLGPYLNFAGTYVGGSLVNPFGPSAAIPVEAGMTTPSQPAPAAIITGHLTDRVYDEFGVQRSASPTAAVLTDTIIHNPTSFRFAVPGWEPVLINEFGYRNEAGPNDPKNWARFGAMYNFSQYQDFRSDVGTRTNEAFYFLYDRQLWQAAPSSPETAYRGIYAGVSAMYAPPEVNAFSQYYEARVYALGLFPQRPFDMITVVYNHQVVSHYLADGLDSYSEEIHTLLGIPYGRHATNTITGSYTARLMPGLYTTVGLSYTDFPALTYYSPATPTDSHVGRALNFVASAFVVF